MASGIELNLYNDWIETVKEVFRGSSHTLPDDLTGLDIAVAYFLQTAQSEQEAEVLAEQNRERFMTMEKAIKDNFATVILPDIRSRTGYTEDQFEFKWVYNQGEHIIEVNSEYRIPL
ncbi:hypothetical protein [Paenibacillus sinopodophylli]|uniref:hypothetical protein n=1 Tax=Paenibacillus sinopodophylli TaxID=1837342 RepID=UPI00110CA6E6|nr:hypothetical protein [Paenibacillus sinopodophylli]